MGMRTIKIGFVDFWPDFDYKKFFMYNYLSKYYHLIISDEPDSCSVQVLVINIGNIQIV